MDAKYYCDTMQADLVALKARVYDIISAVESSANKDKLYPQLAQLHALVNGLGNKIDNLKKTCPTDWSADKKSIEDQKSALLEAINIWDNQHIAGGYVGG